MKKYIYATGLLALMAAATSCDKYDIYPEDFDSVFAIRDAGTRNLTVYSTDAITEVPFVVMKGGYDPANPAKATLKTMSMEEFENYKESSGNLLYTAVAPECYSFSAKDGENVYAVPFEFASEQDKYMSATLYIRPAELKKWFDENGANLGDNAPCVPVTLVSETDTVSSYNNVSLVCVDLRTPELSIDIEGTIPSTINKKNLSTEGDNFYTPDGNFSIPCSNPWGFTLNIKVDDQAVTALGYTPLPTESYTMNVPMHFAPGTTYMPLGLKINLNKLALYTTYAIAISIDSENPVTWDSDNNPGDALVINTEKSVIYTVRVVDAVILEKVKLSTDNVTTNDQEPSEGPLSALFDGDTGTFFHSGWSKANPREEVYASYLEITLPKEMSMFRFDMTTRNNATAAGYVKKVHLFGTNDPNNWPTEPFAVIDDMNLQLNGAAVSASFGTDIEPFTSNLPVKYLRFCVMESGGGSLGTTTGSVYWCASELVLYGF